jgi:hypothetical protein|tara:strand:- start:3824 stop:4216 length:393 start_codon:yes stop_codon:yes gene_type:complete
MPKKKVKDVTPEEKLRTDAVNECKFFVDMANKLLQKNRESVTELTEAMTMVAESKVTWLERCAMVLNIDARRCHTDDGSLILAWSDMDGNILRETQDEKSDPLKVFDSIEDLLNLRIDTQDAKKASEVEQ